MNISIVTACPSGVANTIIASGLLKNAAKTLGFNANVECHSTIRQVDLLSQDVLNESDVIVIALPRRLRHPTIYWAQSLPAAHQHCDGESTSMA